MTSSLLQILLAAAGRSAEQGTLLDIVETIGKLVRLIEPLLATATGPQTTSRVAQPDDPAMRHAASTRFGGR